MRQHESQLGNTETNTGCTVGYSVTSSGQELRGLDVAAGARRPVSPRRVGRAYDKDSAGYKRQESPR